MSVIEEKTITGATVLRNGGNGQFVAKPPAGESPINLGSADVGFGMPAPKFVIRDQDENPEPFDEGFTDKHGNRIAGAMEKLPNERPGILMADLLEDIRCGYPAFSEDAMKGDYEVAVENLRHELEPIPELQREAFVEMITFGVQAQMKHYTGELEYGSTPGWADVTYQAEQLDPGESLEPIESTDINRDRWAQITENAVAAAGKARLEATADRHGR